MNQRSWLYSDSFLKRAFAIWGHNAVATLILSIPLIILQIIVVAYMVQSAQHLR